MARRELRIVDTERVVGAVEVGDDGAVLFEQAADQTFRVLRGQVGDDAEAARNLIKYGWSNGYLYLAPEVKQ